MMFVLAKYAATALVIVVVSEIAKRSDRLGALIASLPLVTIMVMVWLYLENQGSEKVANHAYYTFWYVLPTLPMFLLVPFLLNRGVGFWPALLAGILLTFVLFSSFAVVLKHLDVNLIP